MSASYSRFLGIEISQDAACGLLGKLPGSDRSGGGHGNLHGGAISGLLELVSAATIEQAIGLDATFRPVSVNIDFLRAGARMETFATAIIQRLGGRVANISATAWQDDPGKPIAIARTIYAIRL